MNEAWLEPLYKIQCYYAPTAGIQNKEFEHDLALEEIFKKSQGHVSPKYRKKNLPKSLWNVNKNTMFPTQIFYVAIPSRLNYFLILTQLQGNIYWRNLNSQNDDNIKDLQQT
jgi:hypothetical protein